MEKQKITFDQLADILGEKDADVVQARISYDLEQI